MSIRSRPAGRRARSCHRRAPRRVARRRGDRPRRRQQFVRRDPRRRRHPRGHDPQALARVEADLAEANWEKAKEERGNYTVCLVSNINESPEITFINDPYSKLNPKKNIIQTVQVQYSVSFNKLQNIND